MRVTVEVSGGVADYGLRFGLRLVGARVLEACEVRLRQSPDIGLVPDLGARDRREEEDFVRAELLVQLARGVQSGQ
jgi:hypothetical protein